MYILLPLCILYFYDLFHIPLSHWLNSGSTECIVICVNLFVFCMYVCTYWLFKFLGKFTSWWNTSHSMRLAMHMKQLYCHWFDLHEICYLWDGVNFVDPFKFWSKLEESNRYFAWRPTHIFTCILSFQWIYLITFPSKYAVMWRLSHVEWSGL